MACAAFLLAALAVALSLGAPVGAIASWEPAQPINEGPALGEGGVSTGLPPDVVVGANGMATALFFQAGRDQVFFARRAPGASSWAAPQGAAPAPGASGSPRRAQLAANSAGGALGIWDVGGRTQVAGWPADSTSPEAAVEVMPEPSPSVGIDGEGNGYAVAFNLSRSEILFVRRDAATRTWSQPEQIAAGTEPRIAVNAEGDVAVAYRRSVEIVPSVPFVRESQLFVRRQLVGESGFSAEQRLDAPGGQVADHAVAIDDEGAITVVFTEEPSAGTGNTGRAFAGRWPPGAASPGGAELLSSPRPAYRPAVKPAVAVDPQGRVTAAWLELEGSPLLLRLYSAERVDGRGFGHPERISPANEHLTDDESSKPPEGAAPENERSAASASPPYDLAVDAEGTATVVYNEARDGINAPEGAPDIKAARRATGGRWSAPVSLRSRDDGAGPVVNLAPRVGAGQAGQADAVFVQQVDGTPQLMATRFEGPPPASGEHQAMVTSVDGTGAETEILVQWCPAAGIELGETAPTVIAGSGWGIPGRRCSPGNSPEEELEDTFGNPSVETLTNAGYNVLTFDARGFWRSGGEVQVDSPEFEGRDMQALIDYVAHQREAQLDAPGDPRLGMSGGSYGGGIQLVTAALDDRVDAIAPAIAWNSLVTSLFKRESLKAGWAAILFGAGVPTTTLPGVLSPAGIQTGHLPPEIYGNAPPDDTLATGASSGTVSPKIRDWYAKRGPDFLLHRIDAPTLLIQGTVDTLFTLDEAHRNFEALEAAGTEVKMLWFCGGHGACERHGDDREHIDQRVLAWFDHHLRGREVSTGPVFEWVDEDGGWHESASYPPADEGALRGTGSGTLSLAPGELPGSGGVIFATPYSVGSDHPAAVDVPIEKPPADVTLVGAPQLRATYTATGVSTYGTGVEGAAKERTHVYAQIVDNSRHRVVGNQATPIPITLDGEEHELSLPLERIASGGSNAGYSLQIVPQTSVYDGQRAAGQVSFSSIDITLPVPGELAVVGGGGVTGPGGTAKRLGDAGRTRALRCRGLKATITGTRRRDVIRGTRRRDVIVGRAGNDTIRALAGQDVVCAGAGRDRVRGGKGADRLVGGKGADRLFGGKGADRLVGGKGADRLFGGAGVDRVFGGAGRDLLRDGRRRDLLRGGRGIDRIFR